MWDLDTIVKINKEAHRLTVAKLTPRDAMRNLGIRVLGNLPKVISKVKGKPDAGK